jgi:hypothetical protein
VGSVNRYGKGGGRRWLSAKRTPFFMAFFDNHIHPFCQSSTTRMRHVVFVEYFFIAFLDIF